MKKECKVPLGGEFVRIPVYVLWSRTTSSNFYKATKNPNSTVKEN